MDRRWRRRGRWILGPGPPRRRTFAVVGGGLVGFGTLVGERGEEFGVGAWGLGVLFGGTGSVKSVTKPSWAGATHSNTSTQLLLGLSFHGDQKWSLGYLLFPKKNIIHHPLFTIHQSFIIYPPSQNMLPNTNYNVFFSSTMFFFHQTKRNSSPWN